MGIDLKILASNFRERPDRILTTAAIRLDRDPRLLSLFSKSADPCIVQPIPEGMKIGHFEDGGLQYDDKDRHGNPLTFTTSEQVARLAEKVRSNIDEISQWNRAALAFIASLPPETKVILYWC
jgi:hypothetical protein